MFFGNANAVVYDLYGNDLFPFADAYPDSALIIFPGKGMDNAVFHQWLEKQANGEAGKYLRRIIPVYTELVIVADLLDFNVITRIVKLRLKGYKLPLAVQGIIQNVRHIFDHAADIIAGAGELEAHPINGFERIEQKVGADLGLEGLQF